MDELPTEYTAHDLPLVVLSGLGHDGDLNVQNVSGTRLAIQTAECEGERATNLRQQFLARDGSGSAWNASSLPGPNGSLKYHMQSIGRVGMPWHF
jgi:solute carrier family 25 protein 38